MTQLSSPQEIVEAALSAATSDGTIVLVPTVRRPTCAGPRTP